MSSAGARLCESLPHIRKNPAASVFMTPVGLRVYTHEAMTCVRLSTTYGHSWIPPNRNKKNFLFVCLPYGCVNVSIWDAFSVCVVRTFREYAFRSKCTTIHGDIFMPDYVTVWLSCAPAMWHLFVALMVGVCVCVALFIESLGVTCCAALRLIQFRSIGGRFGQISVCPIRFWHAIVPSPVD